MAAHSAVFTRPDTLETVTALAAAIAWLVVVPALACGRAVWWLLSHPYTPRVVSAAAILAGTIAATMLTVDVPWLSVCIAFGGVFGQALFLCWRWADPGHETRGQADT